MILISNLTMDHVTVWWVQLLYLYMCFCLQIVGVGQHQRPGEPQIYDDLSLVYNWGTYIVLTHGPYSFNDWGCLYLISWSCVPGPKLWIRSSWNQWFSVTETLYEFLGFLFQLQIYSQYYVFIFTMSEYLQLKYNDYQIIEHIIYIIYIHIIYIYIYTIYIYIYYIISMLSDLRLCHHCVSGLSTHLLRTRKVTWHNSHSGGGKPLGNPCWPWGVPHSHHSRSLGSFSSSPFCMVSKLL